MTSVWDGEPLKNRFYDLQACRQNLEIYAFGLESVNDGHLLVIAEFHFTGKQNLHHYQRGGRALLSGILACRLKQKCCKDDLAQQPEIAMAYCLQAKNTEAINRTVNKVVSMALISDPIYRARFTADSFRCRLGVFCKLRDAPSGSWDHKMILEDAVVLEWEEAKNEIEKLAAKRMEKIQAQKDCEIHANKREDTLPIFVANTINGPKQDCKPDEQPSQKALDNMAQFHHVLICVACQYQDVQRLRSCSKYLKQMKTLRIPKEKVMAGKKWQQFEVVADPFAVSADDIRQTGALLADKDKQDNNEIAPKRQRSTSPSDEVAESAPLKRARISESEPSTDEEDQAPLQEVFISNIPQDIPKITKMVDDLSKMVTLLEARLEASDGAYMSLETKFDELKTEFDDYKRFASKKLDDKDQQIATLMANQADMDEFVYESVARKLTETEEQFNEHITNVMYQMKGTAPQFDKTNIKSPLGRASGEEGPLKKGEDLETSNEDRGLAEMGGSVDLTGETDDDVDNDNFEAPVSSNRFDTRDCVD
ncbi:hypothetical protein B0T11DRAFT_296378 [Plectosphaerella cucumerina]|uniref:Uncharacterized protein n=1 Tax=Plectosphaerella cucumerina TaxID=40658 RepID=A0A8K0TND0_9PEZI|nr:hypothetical protein B0T11DRAFT_296378 [Plectosphaerella cucumerina]